MISTFLEKENVSIIDLKYWLYQKDKEFIPFTYNLKDNLVCFPWKLNSLTFLWNEYLNMQSELFQPYFQHFIQINFTLNKIINEKSEIIKGDITKFLSNL